MWGFWEKHSFLNKKGYTHIRYSFSPCLTPSPFNVPIMIWSLGFIIWQPWGPKLMLKISSKVKSKNDSGSQMYFSLPSLTWPTQPVLYYKRRTNSSSISLLSGLVTCSQICSIDNSYIVKTSCYWYWHRQIGLLNLNTKLKWDSWKNGFCIKQPYVACVKSMKKEWASKYILIGYPFKKIEIYLMMSNPR